MSSVNLNKKACSELARSNIYGLFDELSYLLKIHEDQVHLAVIKGLQEIWV
jgi:hypothetical protein